MPIILLKVTVLNRRNIHSYHLRFSFVNSSTALVIVRLLSLGSSLIFIVCRFIYGILFIPPSSRTSRTAFYLPYHLDP